MSKAALGQTLGALPLIEQAFYLLRQSRSGALAAYYMGTLPFVLALLYFWSDMSRNAFAVSYCSPAAAGLALLFVWMKLCHVLCCRRLWCALQGRPNESWPMQRLMAMACRQTVLHATAVVVLPLAAIVAVPLAWVYAYYQNLTILDDPDTKSTRALSRLAKRQALLWPGQNHVMLCLVSLFGLVVFINWLRALPLLPYLLKYLLGVETVFTISGMHLLNTTYLVVLCALTYLCVDPIIKAVYTLRCYYGVSLRSGEDLRADLKPFLKGAALVLLVWVALIPQARASQERVSVHDPWENVSDPQEYVARLDQAIETTLQQPHFAWRLPKTAPPDEDEKQGWLMQSLRWLGDTVRAALRKVGAWISGFFDWLMEKLLPDKKLSESTGRGSWRQTLRFVFYILGAGLVLMLVYWLVRGMMQRRPGPKIAPEIDAAADIDISDEKVTAQDLPLDSWLEMARELMANQDFQKALRALYLSVLALLADHRRVVIARHKSNNDYAKELARRAHAEPELLATFGWCIKAFERAWYGTHQVTRDQLEAFMGQQEKITAIVQTTA